MFVLNACVDVQKDPEITVPPSDTMLEYLGGEEEGWDLNNVDASREMDMEVPVEIDMTTPVDMSPPPMCDVPDGGQCVGNLHEECQGNELIQTNCADSGERCVSDNLGARCEAEPQEVDLCEGNYCSNNGWCDGECICDPGHTGEACDLCAPGWPMNAQGTCAPTSELNGTPNADLLRGR